MRTLTPGALLSAVLFLTPGAAAEQAARGLEGRFRGHNIIMISLGNVGADHMSLYGYPRETTPALERWSRGAVVFRNAFSHASWTMPAATSLFTSLYPYAHRMFYRDLFNVLDPAIKTLPEILRDAGYRTAAFTGGLDHYKGLGHMRGFSEADNNDNFTGFKVTLQQAKAWLKRRSAKDRFFLFVHGYDAHCPFLPPADFQGRFSKGLPHGDGFDPRRCIRGFLNSESGDYQCMYAGREPDFRRKGPPAGAAPVTLTHADVSYLAALHDETVASADALVGAFLSSLPKELLDRTLIVIVSEHGEMFAKHGRFGRAGTIRGTLYDDVLRVPLIIRLPRTAPRAVTADVELIDVMPTLLSCLGLRSPSAMQGKSLLPLLAGAASHKSETFAGLPFRGSVYHDGFLADSVNESIRRGGWKLIREVVTQGVVKGKPRDLPRRILQSLGLWSPKPPQESFELYAVSQDPEEQTNVLSANPEVAADLKARLDLWRAACQRFSPRLPATREIPESLRRDAAERGYW